MNLVKSFEFALKNEDVFNILLLGPDGAYNIWKSENEKQQSDDIRQIFERMTIFEFYNNSNYFGSMIAENYRYRWKMFRKTSRKS